jgi:predicted nuclease of restriction endonuclease-like (RecB) superfamily
LEDAGLFQALARETDSFNTVERIWSTRRTRQYWLLSPRKRVYPLGYVPAALVCLPAAARRQEPEARKFYEAEAIRAGWSVRQLERQIGSQFYERIALSRNKAGMLEKAEVPEPSDGITPEEVIKAPFVLEFLNLKDEYFESELEEALIHHLADFLLELGDDFAFIGRQRRLRLDDTRYAVTNRPRVLSPSPTVWSSSTLRWADLDMQMPVKCIFI